MKSKSNSLLFRNAQSKRFKISEKSLKIFSVLTLYTIVYNIFIIIKVIILQLQPHISKFLYLNLYMSSHKCAKTYTINKRLK